jgi:hypothetical protein
MSAININDTLKALPTNNIQHTPTFLNPLPSQPLTGAFLLPRGDRYDKVILYAPVLFHEKIERHESTKLD